MSILDKRYKTISLDINTRIFNTDLNMIFSISDNETSDFYIKITKNLEDIDLSNYFVVLWIKKPDGTTLSKTVQQNIENGLFYCNLEEKLKDQVGTYKVQIYIEDPDTFERVTTLGIFKYEVLDDILHKRQDLEEPSEGEIEVTYNETDKTLVFDCDATYNSDSNTVEVN